MGFAILNPRDDAAQWANTIDTLPAWLRDVHFSGPFMLAQELLGHVPRLAVYTHADYCVVQPIIIRDIEISGKKTGYRDISSAFGGFGGPAANHELYSWFYESFSAWCRDNKIVSEFCALHPLMHEHQTRLLASGPELRRRKDVVVLDLTRDFQSKYDANRKRDLEKASQSGLKIISVTPDPKGVEVFVTLYWQTMARKMAASRWYLTDEYLRAIAATGTLFHAVDSYGEISCSSLMLSSGFQAYYHLTANARAHRGANELVVDAMAQEAKRQGCKWFHLGGGVTSAPDDGVMAFKAGFSDLRKPAMSYFRVFNQGAYNRLCAAKVEQEMDETGAEFTTSFEPMYRREREVV